MMIMAKYNIKIGPDTKTHIVAGNIKTGAIAQYNTLPGNKPLTLNDGTVLTDIVGTCGCMCEGCYAVNSAKRYCNTVIPSQAENTLLLRERPQQVFDDIKAYVKAHKTKVFRYHASGEIESYMQLIRMARTAEECPETIFYFYTKRFDYVEQYINDHEKFPDNLICNLSEWNGNLDKYGDKFAGINRFVYDDGSDPTLKSLPHCPSVVKKPGAKKGTLSHKVTCLDCGRCFHNHGKRIAVYNH